jgi:hypothetical protein
MGFQALAKQTPCVCASLFFILLDLEDIAVDFIAIDHFVSWPSRVEEHTGVGHAGAGGATGAHVGRATHTVAIGIGKVRRAVRDTAGKTARKLLLAGGS